MERKKAGKNKKSLHNQNFRILVYILIIFTFLLLGYLFPNPTGKAVHEVRKTNITRVIDGDTLETNLGKIRLLGMNAPEKNQYYYEEAKNFLKKFEGEEVELRIKEKDKYKRFLAYVFYQDKNINEEILLRGLAHLFIYEEDKYTQKLQRAERTARNQRKGIWEKSEDECASCIMLIELSSIDPGEYVELRNICDFNCNLKGWTIKDSATHIKKLNFSLSRGEEKKIEYKGRVWNDAGDTLFLRDEKGLLVLWHRY